MLGRKYFGNFMIWHTQFESNKRQEVWRLLCYHYTIGAWIYQPRGWVVVWGVLGVVRQDGIAPSTNAL